MKKLEGYAPLDREPIDPFAQALAARLKEGPLPAVPQEEIDAAAQNAAFWYASAQGLGRGGLWRAALASVTADAAPFWLLCALVLGGGVAAGLAWADRGAEPLAVLLPLAPVPLLCFLIRELQVRDAALAQLERCCALDPARVCLLRLWSGTLANGLVTALMGAALGGETLRLCLCAFAALFCLGTAALMVLPLGGGPLPLSLLLAGWVLGAFWLLTRQGVAQWLMQLAPPLWAAAAGLGLGLFALASVRASRRLYA